MAIVHQKEYTCDACLHNAMFRVGVEGRGWGSLMINDLAPESSMDHDAWVRYLLCPDCLRTFQAMLPQTRR